MPFNLLLLPLVGGFIFFSHWNRTKYPAERQEKERILLYSSFVGIILLGISLTAATIIPYIPLLRHLPIWWAYHTPAIQFSGISSFAFTLGVGGQYLLNKLWPFRDIWNEKKEAARAIAVYGRPLEQLLHRALIEKKRVMVTLSSGKVYIGWPVISMIPEKETAIYLLPTKSGYRESDRHRMELTTHYDEVYRDIFAREPLRSKEMIGDFGVVVPVRELVSASLYRQDVHHKYFPHDEAGPTPQQPDLSAPQQISTQDVTSTVDTQATESAPTTASIPLEMD